MKRSLKKYDNGGKTKKPVFPGKLDNRVVSDNTSVQRPTIQKQDVRLKTPKEVKKERYSKIFNYDNIEIDPITNKPTGKGALESVYPEAVLLPGTPAIKGLGAVGNFALDMLNPLSGARSLKIKPKELLDSGNVDDLVDLWRIQERRARPMSELAAEGKLGPMFQNEKAIQHFKDREKYFGQWFTKDKADFDFYKADREFVDPEIIQLQVPKSRLAEFQNYDKTLSRAADREFVIPLDQQKLFKLKQLPSSGKFNSEIDWGKWNKEIPSNQPLLQEYNAIEQSTKKAGTWMKNPDGSAFQGTPEQFVQQNSQNFKNAFGNSKLVNADGSPKIIYHGTRNGNLVDNEFKAPSSISSDYRITNRNTVKDHNYFASNKEEAEGYASGMPRNNPYFISDPKTYDVYANIENPYLAGDLEVMSAGTIPNISNYDAATNLDLGINTKNKFAEIAIPYWNKVKSAIGNNGMFDMANPNIYKSIAPYAIPTAIGAGALQQNQKEKQFAKGGVIKDDRGQWAHPGKITEIDSNNITMQGVNYPVLGISDQGDTQMMYPEQNYQFKGNKVTEYPMMQRGGTVKPIVVTNPNDPRLRAYNDSLAAYNLGERLANGEYEYSDQQYGLYNIKDTDNQIDKFKRFKGLKPITYQITAGGSGGADYAPMYKKPVQPVIYNPIKKQTATAEQIKPLYQVPQLTMPERLELSMNKPDAVQSAEGPTFKQGRKFMRETGLRPGFYEDGGTINNMKKRTLKKYQYSYGGLTVTDLNKYQLGGSNLGDAAKIKPYDFNKLSSGLGGGSTSGATAGATGSVGSGSPTPSPTGAAVGGLSSVANAIAPGAGAVVPILDMMSKATSDEYGAPDSGLKGLHNRANPLANINRIMEGKDVGRSLLGLSGVGFFSEATGLSKAMFGKSDYDIEAEKREAEKKNKETYTRMNTSENWGNADVNTSTNMMFPDGGMVLNYDDPNANAELELQETFQMPDGTVGNVDGPSHEMGGIAVDLPEGTRIWSDKLKHNGKTFAKHTKPITNKIARLEKEIAKSPNNSEAKENSIALLNQQLDYYFDTQETNKQNTEMKRTLREGGMIKRADGSYSKRGLWDNIRANKGSGKKPTPEMLKQERKIRANEKAMGGYMYAEGGINNPGFRALPEEVQENILANMGMGGEMYSLGGRLMNTPMYAEGGKLPEGVLKSRLEAHMSPEEADEYLSEYGKGGYTVRRSSDRKGKTHVVIGPDGTKKYFGDPNLGERGKSKYGKEAFYARHKKNLAGNPYFRAYARATWEDGGMMGDEYAQGGIHIKPENKGKFTAYAKSHGKGVQEMAAHIMANKEDYSPTIVKRANFAKNAAGWKHRMGGYLPMYQDGDMVGNPNRVAIGAMNPRTGQPYTMDDVTAYTQMENLMPTPFGKEYGGAKRLKSNIPGFGSSYGIMEGNYDKTVLPIGYSPKVNYAQSTLTPNEPFNQLPEGVRRLSKFNLPAFGSNTNQYIAPENLTMDNVGAPSVQKPSMIANRPISQIGNTPTLPMPQRAGTGNYGEFYLPKRGQAYTDAVVENSPVTREEIQQANAMGNFPTGVNNPVNPETTPETPGFFDKAGKFIQNNPGLVGQLGTAALTAGSQMNRINKLARPRTLADVRLRENVANPNLVDYSAERNAIDRTALNAMGEAQRGFGSSAAAQAFKNKARLNQLEGTGRSFQGQENANAQIRNQFLAARQEAAMKEAMMNNEIDKYNLENVYGYDTMTTAQKNAITAMLGNTAGQAFGKQSDYANQLQQANILANQYDPSVLNDMIKNGKLKVVDGQIVKARNGGTIKKRSFKK